MNISFENIIEGYWNNLNSDYRSKLLSENQFWCGFLNYRYNYIPEDLKQILRLKIKDKEVNQ